MRVVVAPSEDHKAPPPAYRLQGEFLSLAADRNHAAVCNLENLTAACWITSALAARQRLLRYHYLEGIVYQLLSYRSLTPVHASCVAKEGRGVLLAGPPGAGKSCLAYACARAGLTFVSDDVGYLLRAEAGRRLVGRPRFLRLRPSALTLFPELQAQPVGADIDGEPILEIRLDRIGTIRAESACAAAAVVFLERRAHGPAGVVPLEPGIALERLVKELPVIGAAPNLEQVDSLGVLAHGGAYRLTYCELGSAVEAVRGLLENTRRPG